MDPSVFLPYSPPTGLPQESKLATYMNRNTSTPARSLSQALGKLSLDSSPTAVKKLNYHTPYNHVLMGEFVPVSYYNASNILPESPESSPPSTLAAVTPTNTQVHQENVGGTTYFYTNSDSLNTSRGLNSSASIGSDMGGGAVLAAVASPYASQIYSPTTTHLMPPPPKTGLAQTFYMPDTIRSEIYQRNEHMYLQPDFRQFPELPENVEMYCELVPLEATRGMGGACSYRASHRQSGDYYALRRLPGTSPPLNQRLELWKQIDHPNVVKFHEYFTTNAFGDHSLILVYEYHAGCENLMSKYLSGAGGTTPEGGAFHDPFSSDPDAPRPYTHQKNTLLRAVASGQLLPEAVLWSLLVQLTAALRAIHNAGLACRNLDATKVIMSGCRVRIAWPGATDALTTPPTDTTQAQQDDLTMLGRMALALACRSTHWGHTQAAMDLIARTYSADFKHVVLYLITASPSRRSVTDLMPMIGARFYTQVEALERRADEFENQLAREIDNGRLLRILVKLGVINERPELNMDPSWSETGDRYMLKLFRDHVFHGVTPDGTPYIDYAHLTYCLNQLDAGTPTKVELMSRDEQSVLVVSYAELKHSLEAAFEEVMQAASASQ